MDQKIECGNGVYVAIRGGYMAPEAPYVQISLISPDPESGGHWNTSTDYDFPYYAEAGGGWSGQMADLQHNLQQKLDGRAVPSEAGYDALMRVVQQFNARV